MDDFDGTLTQRMDAMALRVDILYTEDCTGWQTAADFVEQALSDLGIRAEVSYWLIDSDRKALDWYFIGSPSIRVNGYELFPLEGATAGMRLRSYHTDEGLLDHPTYRMVVSALRAFVKQSS